MSNTSPDDKATVGPPKGFGTGPAPDDSPAPPSVEQDPESAESDALIGQLLAERYRVEELLGRGGMGAVYRARHVHMQKSVAVKVLHREMTYLPEVVARFEREAVAAARIEHPHVAAATDCGRLEDGAFYLVLEYVEGRSLRHLLKEYTSLPAPLALHITRQIAEALDAAHTAEIVHRDLKPDNIMLIEKDGDPHFVKVLDFGIAKVNTGDEAQQLTQLGSVFGTPEYMSPEQAAGSSVDSRSDLYTLGIMLYEMLTGATPFDDSDMVVVLTRQMTLAPEPLPPSIPASVSALVNCLLHKDPGDRVQTASALVEWCDRLLASGVDQLLADSAQSPLPMSVAAASGPNSVEYSETVLSVARPEVYPETPNVSVVAPRSGHAVTKFLLPLTRRVPILGKNVNLGGQPVPVWAVLGVGVAVAGLLVVLFGAVVVASATTRGDAVAAPGSSAAAVEPDLGALIALAQSGDRDAIAKVQARPEADRTAKEWHALGRGYAVIGHGKPSLEAYDKALTLEPSLASDAALMKDVVAATADKTTVRDALSLAVRSLGAPGADLVYFVNQATRNKKDVADTHTMSRTLLESETLRQKASPALLVALDLNKARGCAAVRPVVERAVTHADARSLPKLKSFTARNGCGFLGMGDCFACLRGNSNLADAVRRADSTPAPKFE